MCGGSGEVTTGESSEVRIPRFLAEGAGSPLCGGPPAVETKMNLTAVREAGKVMERHVEHSLAIVPALCDSCSSFCDVSKGKLRLVDVGSCAGLPSIVLIARPDWQVTLLESMKKRCTFLKHAVRIIELTNVAVVHGRSEDLGHNLQFRECFDVAVARAVASMRFLDEYCLPLVRVGELFVASKGHDPQDEVKNARRAIQLMGGSVLKLCTVESSSPYRQGTAIICLKERPTPRRYPVILGLLQKNLCRRRYC